MMMSTKINTKIHSMYKMNVKSKMKHLNFINLCFLVRAAYSLQLKASFFSCMYSTPTSLNSRRRRNRIMTTTMLHSINTRDVGLGRYNNYNCKTKNEYDRFYNPMILITPTHRSAVQSKRKPSLLKAITSTGGSTNMSNMGNISTFSVFLSVLPLLSTIIASHIMKLNLKSRIVISAFRNFLQLSTLGLILRPIFLLQNPVLVMMYMLFLTVLAAFEASTRTKYFVRGQFQTVLVSLLCNIIITTLYAFSVVIKPKPFYNPQILIPVTGMILGNCINGISLSLNSLTSSIVEKQREIELYLSFGATGSEAVSRLLREAIQAGMTPVLNNMSVMGLISIPGMMTGQMLGGSSATEAARWQMLIMYLIGFGLFGTVVMNTNWTARGAFSTHGIRKEEFGKKMTRNWMKQNIFMRDNVENYPSSSTKLLPGDNANNKANIKVNIISFSHEMKNQKENSKIFNVEDLSVIIPQSNNTEKIKNILFKNLSFQVKEGEIAFINGPSGSGKSSLLRVLGKLSSAHHGSIELMGGDLDGSSETWRKNVRYLTQYKVDIPGSPMETINKFTSFQSWRKESSDDSNLREEMKQETIRLIRKWGLTNEILEQDWITLSGGESQRVILAMAIASKPQVLLLDESTSALDQATKIIVEQTVVEEIAKHGMAACWISHDSDRKHLCVTMKKETKR